MVLSFLSICLVLVWHGFSLGSKVFPSTTGVVFGIGSFLVENQHILRHIGCIFTGEVIMPYGKPLVVPQRKEPGSAGRFIGADLFREKRGLPDPKAS